MKYRFHVLSSNFLIVYLLFSLERFRDQKNHLPWTAKAVGSTALPTQQPGRKKWGALLIDCKTWVLTHFSFLSRILVERVFLTMARTSNQLRDSASKRYGKIKIMECFLILGDRRGVWTLPTCSWSLADNTGKISLVWVAVAFISCTYQK